MAGKLTPTLFGVEESKDISDSIKRNTTLLDAANFLSAQLPWVFEKNPEQVKALLNPYLDMLIVSFCKMVEWTGGILDYLGHT